MQWREHHYDRFYDLVITSYSIHYTKLYDNAKQLPNYVEAVESALGVDQLKLITTGGNSYEAEREQWNDANNLLTVKPGVVIGYERNVYTNEKYDKAGIRNNFV